MIRRGAVLFLALAGLAGPALADCTDGAAPKVKWHRCLQDNRTLTGVDLGEAVLREATFLRSDLSGSSLRGADAYRAKFVSGKLTGTVFDGARLIEADFSRADLTGASFKDADLRSARFYEADLRKANFSGARLERADLRNADLAGATWTDGKRVCVEPSVGQCN